MSDYTPERIASLRQQATARLDYEQEWLGPELDDALDEIERLKKRELAMRRELRGLAAGPWNVIVAKWDDPDA